MSRRPPAPKPRCKNCGDETTFTTSGDRQPDYQRETLGWCRRCWQLGLRQNSKAFWSALHDAAAKARNSASDIGSTIALALVCALSISRAFGVWGIEFSEQGVPAQRHDVMGASPAVYIHPERGKSRTVWTRGAASPGPQLALGVGLVSSGGAS